MQIRCSYGIGRQKDLNTKKTYINIYINLSHCHIFPRSCVCWDGCTVICCQFHTHTHTHTHTHRHTHTYIYYPLYTNWPITNADLPHVIIQYILYFICQKLYWTASGQLSNIGYIGQFQNEATCTLCTRCRRTKAVSMYLMKILSIFLHLRKILICFRIGWFL